VQKSMMIDVVRNTKKQLSRNEFMCLRRTCRQNRLYRTLFHTVTILSRHHHQTEMENISNTKGRIFGIVGINKVKG
jgi:hypothetical protein